MAFLLFLLLSNYVLSSHYINFVKAKPQLPFTLGIRDSLMIAHSFHDHPAFGPAGKMHGATYTCDVEFNCEELEPELNWVMDIGKATELVAKVLSRYNLKNLDEIFPNGEMTTTEFMAKKIQQDLAEELSLVRNEDNDNEEVVCSDDSHQISSGRGHMWKGRIRVTLWESHKAWASYEGGVD